MKNPLDDIEKNNYFTTPEGYFDDLPNRIQNRVITPSKRFNLIPVLKYSIPVILLFIIGFIVFMPDNDKLEELILADITEIEVLEYLEASDLSYNEIISELEFEDDYESLIAAPSLEEEYVLDEEILYSPDWMIDSNTENIDSNTEEILNG